MCAASEYWAPDVPEARAAVNPAASFPKQVLKGLKWILKGPRRVPERRREKTRE
jgi:hypothetical protein